MAAPAGRRGKRRREASGATAVAERLLGGGVQSLQALLESLTAGWNPPPTPLLQPGDGAEYRAVRECTQPHKLPA